MPAVELSHLLKTSDLLNSLASALDIADERRDSASRVGLLLAVPDGSAHQQPGRVFVQLQLGRREESVVQRRVQVRTINERPSRSNAYTQLVFCFRNLDRDIETSSKRWKKFVESDCPEREKFPQEWKNKVSLHRLMMMRALRPDRMTYAMSWVITRNSSLWPRTFWIRWKRFRRYCLL